eukprot:361483-Chlamydomonas_euryale.AAC.1
MVGKVCGGGGQGAVRPIAVMHTMEMRGGDAADRRDAYDSFLIAAAGMAARSGRAHRRATGGHGAMAKSELKGVTAWSSWGQGRDDGRTGEAAVWRMAVALHQRPPRSRMAAGSLWPRTP